LYDARSDRLHSIQSRPAGTTACLCILRQGTPGALQRHWIPIPPRIADVGPGVWSGRFPWFERNFEGLDGELLRA